MLSEALSRVRGNAASPKWGICADGANSGPSAKTSGVGRVGRQRRLGGGISHKLSAPALPRKHLVDSLAHLPELDPATTLPVSRVPQAAAPTPVCSPRELVHTSQRPDAHASPLPRESTRRAGLDFIEPNRSSKTRKEGPRQQLE